MFNGEYIQIALMFIDPQKSYMGRYSTELDLLLAPTGTGARNGFINVMPVALSTYHKVT